MTDRKNIVEFPERERIEAQAADWIAVMDSGDLSPEERGRFERWMAASPVHKEAVERMTAIWNGYDVLDEYNRIDALDVRPAIGSLHLRPTAWIGGAIAASFLLVASILISSSFLFGPELDASSYATVIGEQKRIKAVDGSEIVVNTDSEISIEFTRTARKVTLLRGEAHFEVTRDPDRPFQVYAGGGLVEAVGTAFAVELGEGNVEVTVSEGVVKLLTRNDVQDRNIDGAESKSKSAYNSLAALMANQSAIFDDKIELIERIDNETLDRRLAWRNGLLIFDGESLAEAIEEISRYTDIEIIIDDPVLASRPVGGAFEVGDVDALFGALDELFDVNVMRETPSRVRLARR